MVKKLFKNMRCVFVPVDSNVNFRRLEPHIGQFITRGGTAGDGCNASTDYIVATTWWEVKHHFSGFPGLFEYFTEREGVRLVSHTWIVEEIEANEHLQPDEWLLTPERNDIPLYIKDDMKSFIGPIHEYTRDNVGPVLKEYEKWWVAEIVKAQEAVYKARCAKDLQEHKKKQRKLRPGPYWPFNEYRDTTP
jgi:hypothetical protein